MRVTVRVLAWLLVLGLGVSHAWAQGFQGGVRGAIKDSGGVILRPIGERVQHHVGTESRHFLGHAEADSGVRPGDDDAFSGDRHALLPSQNRRDHTFCACEIARAVAAGGGAKKDALARRASSR